MTSDEFVSWLEGIFDTAPRGKLSTATKLLIKNKLKEVTKGSPPPVYIPVNPAPTTAPAPYTEPWTAPYYPPYTPTPFWAGPGTGNPIPKQAETICKNGDDHQIRNKDTITGT